MLATNLLTLVVASVSSVLAPLVRWIFLICNCTLIVAGRALADILERELRRRSFELFLASCCLHLSLPKLEVRLMLSFLIRVVRVLHSSEVCRRVRHQIRQHCADMPRLRCARRHRKRLGTMQLNSWWQRCLLAHVARVSRVYLRRWQCSNRYLRRFNAWLLESASCRVPLNVFDLRCGTHLVCTCLSRLYLRALRLRVTLSVCADVFRKHVNFASIWLPLNSSFQLQSCFLLGCVELSNRLLI